MNDEPGGRAAPVDFAALYDRHSEYAARRVAGSFEQARILLEATEFKIPWLCSVLPPGETPRRVLEIGCATGELIAHFPVQAGGRRVGCDISAENVRAAQARFHDVEFFAGDFSELTAESFDCVILSDVLEHVEADGAFLARAARLGRFVLVNLPLEDNWLNRRRRYGPDDSSGHLRRYSLRQGLDLFARAGLNVLDYRQVWIHETAVDEQRRRLRRRHEGRAFGGPLPVRVLKRAVLTGVQRLPPLGRRLFASNLFARAIRNSG